MKVEGWRSAALLSAGLLLGSASFAFAEFKEAPMLAEKVAAGELPPVTERLPAEPLVVTPLESTGTYGGTLRGALTGSSDTV